MSVSTFTPQPFRVAGGRAAVSVPAEHPGELDVESVDVDDGGRYRPPYHSCQFEFSM